MAVDIVLERNRLLELAAEARGAGDFFLAEIYDHLIRVLELGATHEAARLLRLVPHKQGGW